MANSFGVEDNDIQDHTRSSTSPSTSWHVISSDSESERVFEDELDQESPVQGSNYASTTSGQAPSHASDESDNVTVFEIDSSDDEQNYDSQTTPRVLVLFRSTTQTLPLGPDSGTIFEAIPSGDEQNQGSQPALHVFIDSGRTTPELPLELESIPRYIPSDSDTGTAFEIDLCDDERPQTPILAINSDFETMAWSGDSATLVETNWSVSEPNNDSGLVQQVPNVRNCSTTSTPEIDAENSISEQEPTRPIRQRRPPKRYSPSPPPRRRNRRRGRRA